jgi:hypothetical protein
LEESWAQKLHVVPDFDHIPRPVDTSAFLPNTIQMATTIPMFPRHQNLDGSEVWDTAAEMEFKYQMELLMEKFNEEKTLRLQERAEIAELQDALVKSTEKLQRIQATLEKPLITSPQTGSGKLQRLLHMARGGVDESTSLAPIVRESRGGFRSRLGKYAFP